MHINYKTYNNLINDIKSKLHLLPEDLDIIVGVPRSGMVPAYMLGQLLKLPVFSVNELKLGILEQQYSNRFLKKITNKIPKILIVDDSLRSGYSLKNVQQSISNLQTKYKILWGAIYVCGEQKNILDWYVQEITPPRFFQWNYLNHPEVTSACYDIDGVLCYDPTEEENDDGEKYIHFLKNAKPLFIPSYKIHALVTSRLEKYRAETEEWLRKNNVQYEKLYMLNLKSKEERIKLGAHAIFKSEIYSKLKKTNIFYESNSKQAAEISALTKKPVFCIENDTLYLEGNGTNDEIKNTIVNKKYPRWLIKCICLFIPSSKKRKLLRHKYMKARH